MYAIVKTNLINKICKKEDERYEESGKKEGASTNFCNLSMAFNQVHAFVSVSWVTV